MQTRRILFLCTHNAARSILAEGLANHLGGPHICAVSAGSHPSERAHPHALATLREHGCSIDGLYSKSWHTFTAPDADPIDAVITVCNDSAGEACPLWPGTPAQAHWGLPDPSRVDGDNTAQLGEFRITATRLIRRLQRVLALPLERLDPPALQHALQQIHEDALHEELST